MATLPIRKVRLREVKRQLVGDKAKSPPCVGLRQGRGSPMGALWVQGKGASPKSMGQRGNRAHMVLLRDTAHSLPRRLLSLSPTSVCSLSPPFCFSLTSVPPSLSPLPSLHVSTPLSSTFFPVALFSPLYLRLSPLLPSIFLPVSAFPPPLSSSECLSVSFCLPLSQPS